MSNYPDNFATTRAASFFGTDADDRRADRAAEIVDADMEAATKLRDAATAFYLAIEGITFHTRHAGGWDASPEIRNSHTHPPEGLYGQAAFREGFAQLAPLGLSFEAWQYHPQLPEVIALARAFPQTSIILNHVGGPLGVGPYAGQTESVFARWKQGMVELARCPNVTVKLGGLGMRIGMFDLHLRDQPPSSQQIAQAWQPWMET